MDFYETERRRAIRAVPQPMCFDNTAWFDNQAQADFNGGRQSRFMERNGASPHAANAFHLNDNQSSTGTTYSIREGHIYEEVGPPSHPPPYCTNSDIDGRIPSVHQTMDQQHMMRGSPSSLCSMCSRHCTGHSASPPTLPQCNCASYGMQQPFCVHHTSIGHQIHQPRTLHGHINAGQQRSPSSCTLHAASPVPDTLHHGMPCTIHQHNTMVGVSNQRYTAPAGTMTPETNPHNNQVETSNKPKDRSLSPFAFLRKNNRDSKASTNTMLDTASGKSVLMCSRRWLVAIVLTLVLIIVLSVAVGLAVTFTVHEAGKEVTSETTSDKLSPVQRLSSKLEASVRIIKGSNSVFTRGLARPSSQEYRTYTDSFTYQTNKVLKTQLPEQVDYTEVERLRNGSVIVDFIIHLQGNEFTESQVIALAATVKLLLHREMNSTEYQSSFQQAFPLAQDSIMVKPIFSDNDNEDDETTEVVTTLPPTSELTTTSLPTTSEPYTLPPASGVCEPITNPICQQIHYNSSGTTYPNFVGHNNQEEATVFIEVLNAIMASTACYDYLNTFSCALLAPKCGEDNVRIPPCKRLCDAAFHHCGPYMNAIMSSQQHIEDCSSFPNSTDPDVCVDEQGPVVPTAAPSCPPNFYSCGNQLCTAMKNRCDSVPDCADSSDEEDCDGFQCVAGQFQCKSGQCRPKVWKCDGSVDCDDESDEEDCVPTPPCQVGEFKCIAGFDHWNSNAELENDVCIESKFTCDGTKDCSDDSDEDEVFCRDRQ